jgi:Mg-chelatase subunit ChlD
MTEQMAVAEPPVLAIGKIDTPKQFAQLGILVMDGSGSMTDLAAGNIQKAQATNHATREMFTRFKVSRVGRNFAFSVITFDTGANLRLRPVEVGPQLDDNADYNPLNGHGGGTNMFTALELARDVADGFIAAAPAGGVPHSAVVLVMSDGCCSDPVRTQKVADSIKQGVNGSRIKICSTLFASVGKPDSAGEQLLRSIASDAMSYKTVYDAETLRSFFEASLSAASGGIHIV